MINDSGNNHGNLLTQRSFANSQTTAVQAESQALLNDDEIDIKVAQCFCCYKKTGLTLISQLKPKIVKLLQNDYGESNVHPNSYVCSHHLTKAMQDRVDALLEEDKHQISKLQEDAMRNLEQYELDEKNWKEKFEIKGSFGERAADFVAAFGGSWPFLGYLLLFLLTWAIINLLLGDKAWDPYPFILLNLFLSMLAATQAPIIMMSQNRQAAIDRLQNDFVSKSNLRNEHQTRHVDAKLDYLISYQWKRLLEIQEMQTNMMEVHFKNTKKKKGLIKITDVKPSPSIENEVISRETEYDPLTNALLKSVVTGESPCEFIFSHWHQDGDNFSGHIDEIALTRDEQGSVTLIKFKLTFGTIKATLDDIFSGEGTVTLRNDFNVPEMDPLGEFSGFKIPINNQMVSITNGEFPPRYKPVFSRVREDRINDIWKTHIDHIYLSYVPPPQFATITVPKFKSLALNLTLYPEIDTEGWNIYAYKHKEGESDDILKEVLTRPLSDGWQHIVNLKDEDNEETIQNDVIAKKPINLNVGSLEAGTYTFICDDGRVAYHGTFE
ncbi:hypothetical protein HK103_004802 [Boothiomyces macroporosus]|uniref:DUF1003 domain-containing protein n=1 Tax=Boothiomyces macroporosus TaxID=261099 RepID=A0AAD5Y817_9FUNG|nr:hypothetical protein HK103_004802 [Boothiomyces macroporosus]